MMASKKCFAWVFLGILSVVTAQTSNNDYTGIKVRCTPNYMELRLERQHFEKVDPTSLRLTDSSCGPYFHNDTYMAIRAPLGSCGTTAAREGKLLGFRNEVYADLTGASSISRHPAYQFRLHCRYYTTAKITLHSFKPDTTVIVEPPTEFGNFTFETSMFQTEKYISKYTQFPVKVHVSESIYLQVQIKTNATGLSMLLENCWATPTPDPNNSESYTLIKEGCPVAPFLNYKMSETGYQRFSFDAFQMDGAEVMYLHCEVLVCAKNLENATRCAEGCVKKDSGGSRRKKREADKEKKGVTSLGPLKVLLDRLEVQGPKEAGSRSHSSPVTVEKTAVLATFILASLLMM